MQNFDHMLPARELENVVTDPYITLDVWDEVDNADFMRELNELCMKTGIGHSINPNIGVINSYVNDKPVLTVTSYNKFHSICFSSVDGSGYIGTVYLTPEGRTFDGDSLQTVCEKIHGYIRAASTPSDVVTVDPATEPFGAPEAFYAKMYKAPKFLCRNFASIGSSQAHQGSLYTTVRRYLETVKSACYYKDREVRLNPYAHEVREAEKGILKNIISITGSSFGIERSAELSLGWRHVPAKLVTEGCELSLALTEDKYDPTRVAYIFGHSDLNNIETRTEMAELLEPALI